MMDGIKRHSTWVIIWIYLVLPQADSVTYTKWLRNTDLNNAYNWDTGRLPCGNDRMILPDDGPVVYLQMNTTIQELVLPKSGELVFGSYATLAFTNEPDHSATCLDSGTDATFNASAPADWLDPSNWCVTDTEQGACRSEPRLDSEQVPCSTDNVVFPRGSSYYVNLGTSVNLRVNTIKVSGKAYSTGTFQTFLTSDNGQAIFPPPTNGQQATVTVVKRACSDQTGCTCGNDQGQILASICRVQGPRCVRPQCSGTIRPVGHCCDICGGMLNITYGTGFNLATLKSGLQRNFLDGKDMYRDVKYIVSKRSDGQIQLVLQDADGIQSSKVAMEMFKDINTDIGNGGFKYAVTKVTIATSSGGGAPGGKTSKHTGGGGGGRTRAGTVAGITIAVIIAIVLGLFVAYLVYRFRTRPKDELGFKSVFDKFNRFSAGPRRKPQVSVPPSVGFSWSSHDSGVSSIHGSMAQGFDNPIYGSTPLESMKAMELEMTPGDYSMQPEQGQPIDDRGFDNPLYDSVHQESLFSDPTAVDDPELDKVMTIGSSGQKPSETDA